MSLTTQQQQSWLKHVFFPLAVPKVARDSLLLDGNQEKNKKYIDQLADSINDKPLREKAQAAEKLFKMITQHKFDLLCDDYIKTLVPGERYAFLYSTKDDDGNPTFGIELISPTDAVNALVSMCSEFLVNKGEAEFVWNVDMEEPDKVETFKKTLFGSALDKAGLLRNLGYDELYDNTIVKGGRTSSNGETLRSKKGGLASQLRGLLSSFDADGKVEKIFPSVSNMYKIVDPSIVQASNAGKKATVFIKPELKSKDGEGTRADSNKVIVALQNTYSQAICFFEDAASAQKFADAITAGGYPNSLFIVTAKTDANGYLKANTDYGPVLIAAKAFNENLDLEESLLDECNDKLEKSNFEKMKEAYSKISELQYDLGKYFD